MKVEKNKLKLKEYIKLDETLKEKGFTLKTTETDKIEMLNALLSNGVKLYK